MIDSTAVIAAAKTKILDLAYDISIKIDMWKQADKIEQAAGLIMFLRVIQNSGSQLEDYEQDQIIQSLITIGELII